MPGRRLFYFLFFYILSDFSHEPEKYKLLKNLTSEAGFRERNFKIQGHEIFGESGLNFFWNSVSQHIYIETGGGTLKAP